MPFILGRARTLMGLCFASYPRSGSPGGSSAAVPTLGGGRVLFGQPMNDPVFPFSADRRSASGTQGFICENDRGDVVVTFRGSEASSLDEIIRDWLLSDAHAAQIGYPEELSIIPANALRSPATALAALRDLARPRPFGVTRWVHAGFLASYLAVRGDINRVVRSRITRHLGLGRSPRIITTGHSLGGALAKHAGLDLARQFPDVPVHTYTFGAPRVGNGSFGNYAKRKIRELYHVINYRDPVAFVPPLGPPVGPRPQRYQRKGETWYISRRGVIRPNVPIGTTGTNFRNHYQENYVAALRAATINRTPRKRFML